MSKLTHRTRPGYTYFVTTKTWQNRPLFRVSEVALILAEQIVHYRNEGVYLLHAFVIMPDHIHMLLTPDASMSLERAMQYIKGGSSHRIHAVRRHKMSIWQPGFHDWTVRDEEDFRTRVSYIHLNPVRAHLADCPEDWPYGSANGKYATDAMPAGSSFRG
jgi:putative transposase